MHWKLLKDKSRIKKISRSRSKSNFSLVYRQKLNYRKIKNEVDRHINSIEGITLEYFEIIDLSKFINISENQPMKISLKILEKL